MSAHCNLELLLNGKVRQMQHVVPWRLIVLMDTPSTVRVYDESVHSTTSALQSCELD